MDLESQFMEQLKELDKKQLCLFEWRYGLQALPFLSVKRGFAYWSNEKK